MAGKYLNCQAIEYHKKHLHTCVWVCVCVYIYTQIYIFAEYIYIFCLFVCLLVLFFMTLLPQNDCIVTLEWEGEIWILVRNCNEDSFLQWNLEQETMIWILSGYLFKWWTYLYMPTDWEFLCSLHKSAW